MKARVVFDLEDFLLNSNCTVMSRMKQIPSRTDEAEVEFDLSRTDINFVLGTPHQSACADSFPSQGRPSGEDVRFLIVHILIIPIN